MRAREPRRALRLALLGAALSAAPPSGAAPARAAPPREAADVVAAHCAARERLTTLRARFAQTKVFAALGDEERSAGVLLYRKPDAIRWEYEAPDRSWTVIAGQKGWAVFPTIRQVQRFELGGARADGLLAVVGLGRCGAAFEESFEVTLGPSVAAAPVLVLRPLRAELAASFARIDLTLDPESHLPREVVLHEATGDRVRFEFFDLQRGARIDAALFQFTTPKGYVVVP